MMNKLFISPSPHMYEDTTVKRLMFDVVIAMLPALAFSIYFFGMGAIIVTLTAVVSCLAFEWLIQKYMLKQEPSITDGSALVTGILLAFNVPTNLPIWIVIIGSLVAIGIGKMSFGGLGNNPFNPALVGRVFMLISFPVQMTSWPVPTGFNNSYTDAVTGATPLGVMKEGIGAGETVSSIMDKIPSHMELFYGHMGGSMGEIAAIALLLGFGYMLFRKVIKMHIPVSILLTITAFTGILWLINPESNADPVFHLLTGGVMLGAIFMATDYVTSPMSVKGMWIYGIGIGIITVLIRVFGAYPEGVSFAILIMNAFVPLINAYIKPKRFGEEVKNG
ncbi:MAG TPA: Na+-transporting NADH:ubiquinone oxidoreductase subunit D [Bacteroidales bacterium]|nr:Na+-transporting NADH:ubiquinone oxidoreductase subunit D [Bacteroidales bacterium]